MIRQQLLRTGIALATLGSAAAAQAADLPFTGSFTGVSTLIGLDATCAPLPFRSMVDPASTVGVSNFGSFTFSSSTCLAPAGPNAPSNGIFTISFGADSFSGSFAGASNPSSTAGISDVAWTFTILSGTGQYLGATGTLQAAGLADARTRPTHLAISLIGNVNAPALPEPATWMLMLLGFGGIGMVMRRRTQPVLAQLA